MKKFHINKKVKAKGYKNNEYDAVIIGAGIGGLTCGCYLAKAGLKVLIVEQHHKAGGYCTSFKRKGFTFDAAAHYLGGLRENGQLKKIFNEIELDKKVEIIRFDPTDVVIYPRRKIHIWADMDLTLFELQENFKHEAKNIKNFFKLIIDSEFIDLYIQLKDKTFKRLLDEYFKDQQLKSMLGIFLGNIGLPPSRVSALASAILYREFVIDGGYYPKGGMQKFSDAFVEKFMEWGGEILFKKKVEKIVVVGQKVSGIIIDKDNFISSKMVVSNADATNTFIKLVGKAHLPVEFLRKMSSLEISPSAFIVYLGLNRHYADVLENRSSWWCSLSNDLSIEKIYSDLDRKNQPYSDDVVFCAFPSSHDLSLAPPDNEVIFLLVPAKMKDAGFWGKNKYNLADELVKRAEKFVPGLSQYIATREIATPSSLCRYTSNKNGSSYGWAATPLQIDKNTMPLTTPIGGLYLAGHWVTQGVGPGGISSVAYCGKNVAKLIISKVSL